MDDELLDLCEQVSVQTNWQIERWYCYSDRKGWTISDFAHGEKWIPAYNSDYLLEKLPAEIVSKEHKGYMANLNTRKDLNDPDDSTKGSSYFAWYYVTGEEPSDFGVYADTPLKALLKLTLELHRAGEL